MFNYSSDPSAIHLTNRDLPSHYVYVAPLIGVDNVSLVGSTDLTLKATDEIVFSQEFTTNYGKLVAEIVPCGALDKYYRKGDNVPSEEKPVKKREEELSLYPNPGTGIYNINCSHPISAVKVIDIMGRMVFPEKEHACQ